MEFVRNIAWTNVSRKSVTPKFSVNYNFLGQEGNINLPLRYLNTLLYTCLYLRYSIYFFIGPKNTTKLFIKSYKKKLKKNNGLTSLVTKSLRKFFGKNLLKFLWGFGLNSSPK